MVGCSWHRDSPNQVWNRRGSAEVAGGESLGRCYGQQRSESSGRHSALTRLKERDMPQGLAVFSGRANLALASKVCLYVGVQPGCIEVSNFSDGEIYVQIKENVRGRDVFVIQST